MQIALLVFLAITVPSALVAGKLYTGKCSEETWVAAKHQREWQEDKYETVWYLRAMLDYRGNNELYPQCAKIHRYNEYEVDFMASLFVYKDFSISRTRLLTIEEEPEDQGITGFATLIKSIEIREESEPDTVLKEPSTRAGELDMHEINYGLWPFLDKEAALWYSCVADDDFKKPEASGNDASDNYDSRWVFTIGPYTEWETKADLVKLANPEPSKSEKEAFEGKLYKIPKPESCKFVEFH